MPIRIDDADGIIRQINTNVTTNENGELHTYVTAAGGSGTSASQVQGIQASATTNSGNPVKVGAVFMTTAPVYTDGQFGDLQMTARGMLATAIGFSGTGGTFAAGLADNVASVAASATVNALKVLSRNTISDGTNWYPMPGSATGVNIVDAPTGSAGQALATTANAAVGASLVLKASAGNLYGFNIVTGASAGYLMIFDATSAPADGAVTPKRCIAIAANTSIDRTFGKPIRFTSGITLVFSTTGPYTKTASATAFLAGEAV